MGHKMSMYKLNIYLMYGYWFFHNLIFAYVIERLYWASRGMTEQGVVYTEIIYAVVVILLEVPTGALADRWSKKVLLVLSAVLSFSELFILIYANNFWHFALAVALAGLGKALSSGTSNALIFESLKMLGEEHSFEKVSGRIGFFDYSAAMLGALAGSYIAYSKSYITTYWLSLISVFITIIAALFLKDTDSIEEKEAKLDYIQHMKEAFSFLKGKPAIRFVLFFGIIAGAVFTYIDEFWQTYLNAINIPIYLFGIISATRMISSSISGIYAYKLKNKFSYDSIFSVQIITFAASILIASYTKSFVGLMPLIISFISFGVVEPLTIGYLHHRTESRIRATVESFQSLILRAVTIICGLLFGYFSTHFSIFTGFRVLAVISAAYSVYFFLVKKRFI